ncbi:putative enoyl reductase [Aspergillus granulosus]|uniref:Enoyl reductase n=1 Tax=Aspergillus granulosus TaxID=176169 RepID=A0ABR4H5K1_9EURO
MSFNTLPSTQRALKVSGPGQVNLINDASIPHIGPKDVLIQNAYIGLNPYDTKSLDLSPSPGATVGGNFAGEIVAVGEAVASSGHARIGDRVFGCVFGNNPGERDNGAFADYVAVPAQLVIKIPAWMSFQQAATLGIALATAGLALFKGLGLSMNPLSESSESSSSSSSRGTVLVYGGGTATGALTIQVLRRIGFTPITTCSPHSSTRLKSLGAEKTFDYASPTCGSEIHSYTRNNLRYALDCISTTASMKTCYEAIGSPGGGKYLALDPFPLHTHTRRSIMPEWLFLFTQFGKPIAWKRPYDFPARPRDREVAGRWYRVAEKLLEEKLIRPPEYREEASGLQGVCDGLDQMRKGMAGGVKLVYPVRTQ